MHSRKCRRMPTPVGGHECSDFRNPIGRTFLSGPHFRRDWKVSAIREAPPCACLLVGRGGELHFPDLLDLKREPYETL